MSSNPASGLSGGWALHRSVTLLRVFLLASALILVTGGTVLAWLLTTSARDEALQERSANLTEYVDGVLRSELVRGDGIHVSPRLPLRIKAQLRRQPEILSVKVWRVDGTLVWTSRAQELIGRRFTEAGDGDLGATIASGQPHASLGSLDEGEDETERALAGGGLFEVYAPIKNLEGTRVLGVYEIYADATRTESFISARKRVIWLAVFAVFATLYAVLALLVKGASALMRRQAAALRTRSRELIKSYRKLEESSLEAVESLNATVDAKDPYTAGHSARVQRIALAVAEELGLPAERLDAIRFGGLFHDIGKIGVPDRILRKPGTLDPDEFEAIKRHPADGAEIVSHFSRLREAVPLIRHHHERWDGNGYPDRLAGTAIPTEACVVGLADAWDAMTTDRPYRPALTIEEAAAEVRRCRSTQFSPAVVDAFFAAFRKRPSVFEADEPESFDIAATG